MQSLWAELIRYVSGNTFMTTLLVDAVLLFLVFFLKPRISLVPGRVQGMMEGVVDFLGNATEQAAGPRAGMIFPWVAVFFIYIAVSNLLGLIPGVGTMGFSRNGGFVSLFHVSTSDLNVTLALAIVSVIATHAMAIRTIGFLGYLKRFFALNPLLLFVGLLELLQEVTKFITFSFRLYGNISAGEAVLGTMSSLAAFIVPVPFLAFETWWR